SFDFLVSTNELKLGSPTASKMDIINNVISNSISVKALADRI
ncbi:MAG: hypothetical protein ACI945_001895, partial [Pseudohongiellaceae bacterium]